MARVGQMTLKIMGDALGGTTPYDGKYVKESTDTEDGRGHVVATDSIEEALGFDSFEEAMEFWKRPSETVPIRWTDGEPNRPLTAFNIEFARRKAT